MAPQPGDKDFVPNVRFGLPGNVTKLDILREQEKIQKAYQKRSEDDFLCFCRGLTIESQTGPRVFETCMARFQRDVFEAIASSLRAIQLGEMPVKRRWWIERTKKASKDADLAVILAWLVCFPKRPLFMQVGAADRNQAAIVKDRLKHLLHWNPWLNEKVEVVGNEIRSKARQANGHYLARVEIRSSDVAGAHGGTPDVLIINELSHINKFEFAETLMDNADGVAQGMAIIATNAGFKGSKAHTWQLNAIASDDWEVFVWDQPAPWHNAAAIEDARKRNTKSRFARLWKGRWVSGKGSALGEDDITACFVLKGPELAPKPGIFYFGGLDLGVSHDHAGFCILGVDERNQKISTAWWKRWRPGKDGEIYLPDVEADVLGACKIFRVSRLYYDPHQAELMAQRMRRAGIACEKMSFVPANMIKMASALIQVAENRRLECYDDEDGSLKGDLAKFDIVEKSYGHRLEAVSDEFGHADVGTALVIALPAALDFLNGVGMFSEDEVLFSEDDDKDFDEKEMKALPKEMKELFDQEDEEGDQRQRIISRRASARFFEEIE